MVTGGSASDSLERLEFWGIYFHYSPGEQPTAFEVRSGLKGRPWRRPESSA